jgi:hypothetical protein
VVCSSNADLLILSSIDEPVPWPCVQDRAQLPEHRPLQPGSDEAYERIRSWYEACRDDHDICNERGVGKGPSRLLFIGQQPPDRRITVRLVTCDTGVPPSYVALSHCWGASNHLQTTLDNLDEHTVEIDIASLSRTFRDAIAICQYLDESFLWIDSLCIVQDDHEGKAAEIERMQSIYECASLTISAMSASDGRAGCWIPRERVFQIPIDDAQSAGLMFRRVHEVPSEHASFLTEFPDYVLETQYPLATRKWALQERLLSQRLIHLTASELVWECRMHTSCECRILDRLSPGFSTHQRVRDALSRPSGDRHEYIYEWMKLLESYSRGELTRETDALPAIAGLARKFSDRMSGGYFAGMWVEELPMTLCWFSRQPTEGVTPNERPATYVAPSWSWASVQGPLCFDAWDDFGTDYIARTLRKEADREGQCVRRWRDDTSIQFPLSRTAHDPGIPDEDGIEVVANIMSINLSSDLFDSTGFGRIEHGVLRMSTRTCTVGPRSVSENSIKGFEGGEFIPDTWCDIPFTTACVVALVFVQSGEWSGDDDNDDETSDGDGARWKWKGQALVLVRSEEDDGEVSYRRCGLLRVPEESLGIFGEEVVLDIV